MLTPVIPGDAVLFLVLGPERTAAVLARNEREGVKSADDVLGVPAGIALPALTAGGAGFGGLIEYMRHKGEADRRRRAAIGALAGGGIGLATGTGGLLASRLLNTPANANEPHAPAVADPTDPGTKAAFVPGLFSSSAPAPEPKPETPFTPEPKPAPGIQSGMRWDMPQAHPPAGGFGVPPMAGPTAPGEYKGPNWLDRNRGWLLPAGIGGIGLLGGLLYARHRKKKEEEELTERNAGLKFSAIHNCFGKKQSADDPVVPAPPSVEPPTVVDKVRDAIVENPPITNAILPGCTAPGLVDRNRDWLLPAGAGGLGLLGGLLYGQRHFQRHKRADALRDAAKDQLTNYERRLWANPTQTAAGTAVAGLEAASVPALAGVRGLWSLANAPKGHEWPTAARGALIGGSAGLGGIAGALAHARLVDPNDWQANILARLGGATAGGLLANDLIPGPEERVRKEQKIAATVDVGGLPSRATALTLGRANPMSLLNLILSRRAYHSAAKPERQEKLKALVERMTAAEPEKLKDTVLRGEGTDVIDDVLWKKDRKDEGLKWHERVGGRIWQNPKTSIIGKLLGTLGVPATHTLPNLTRSSHYNPYADAASVYGDVPAIASHELGHAVDFNTSKIHTDRNPDSPSIGNRLARDAYTLMYFPPLNLIHETRANTRSRAAIEKSYADDQKAKAELLYQRDRALPAGYGSYVGAALASPFVGPGAAALPLAGMAAGKAYGVGRSIIRRKATERDTENDKNESAKSALDPLYIDPNLPPSLTPMTPAPKPTGGPSLTPYAPIAPPTLSVPPAPLPKPAPVKPSPSPAPLKTAADGPAGTAKPGPFFGTDAGKNKGTPLGGFNPLLMSQPKPTVFGSVPPVTVPRVAPGTDRAPSVDPQDVVIAGGGPKFLHPSEIFFDESVAGGPKPPAPSGVPRESTVPAVPTQQIDPFEALRQFRNPFQPIVPGTVKQNADLAPGAPARAEVPKSDFALPSQKEPETGTKGRYPIPDASHARAALGFAAMHHGSGSAEYKAVASKVHAKYPPMGKAAYDTPATQISLPKIGAPGGMSMTRLPGLAPQPVKAPGYTPPQAPALAAPHTSLTAGLSGQQQAPLLPGQGPMPLPAVQGPKVASARVHDYDRVSSPLRVVFENSIRDDELPAFRHAFGVVPATSRELQSIVLGTGDTKSAADPVTPPAPPPPPPEAPPAEGPGFLVRNNPFTSQGRSNIGSGVNEWADQRAAGGIRGAFGGQSPADALSPDMGKFLEKNRWANYAAWGLPIGAGVGLLGGLFSRKKKRDALGDALSGGLLGAAAGGLGGAVMDLNTTDKKEDTPPAPPQPPAEPPSQAAQLVDKLRQGQFRDVAEHPEIQGGAGTAGLFGAARGLGRVTGWKPYHGGPADQLLRTAEGNVTKPEDYRIFDPRRYLYGSRPLSGTQALSNDALVNQVANAANAGRTGSFMTPEAVRAGIAKTNPTDKTSPQALAIRPALEQVAGGANPTLSIAELAKNDGFLDSLVTRAGGTPSMTTRVAAHAYLTRGTTGNPGLDKNFAAAMSASDGPLGGQALRTQGFLGRMGNRATGGLLFKDRGPYVGGPTTGQKLLSAAKLPFGVASPLNPTNLALGTATSVSLRHGAGLVPRDKTVLESIGISPGQLASELPPTLGGPDAGPDAGAAANQATTDKLRVAVDALKRNDAAAGRPPRPEKDYLDEATRALGGTVHP